MFQLSFLTLNRKESSEGLVCLHSVREWTWPWLELTSAYRRQKPNKQESLLTTASFSTSLKKAMNVVIFHCIRHTGTQYINVTCQMLRSQCAGGFTKLNGQCPPRNSPPRLGIKLASQVSRARPRRGNASSSHSLLVKFCKT